MAESENENRSLVGSVDDYDHCCEPCLTTSHCVEAHGYCVFCQEYLCSNCLECHKKAKISRSHQILKQDEFDKLETMRKAYNECTEKCPAHQNEIIEFYCPSHHALGCKDCMSNSHGNCNIDYIPEQCVDIADGKELDDVMQRLSEKLKEVQEISKKAKGIDKVMNDYNEEIVKEITKFKKEVNDHMIQMQQDILNDTEEIKSSNKRIVQNVLDKCENTFSNVVNLQASLHASKSVHRNGQLYIDMKRAESALKSDALNDAKETLMNTNVCYSFQRNADLEALLSKKMVFGDIINPSRDESDETKSFDRLVAKENIKVITESDRKECIITGCAILDTNKLVLVDNNNDKVKLVSLEDRLVEEEISVDFSPWGIAVISQSQFAVTLPWHNKITVMSAEDELSCVRSIKVDGKCYGIGFNQDCLYVACLEPSSVLVLNTQGDILNNITSDCLSADIVPHIAVRIDSKRLFYSDYKNNSLLCVSLEGEVTAAYKHDDFESPNGMTVLDDGSVFVCSYNGAIHHVKKGLMQGKVLLEDEVNAKSICYSPCYDEVYVGFYGNKLKVFDPQSPKKRIVSLLEK